MIFEDIRKDGCAVLAPMAGITDASFRAICRQKGAVLVFSEMISADGLMQNNERTLEYLFFRPVERPIGFQLFGSNPATLAKAVEIVVPHQPDFIDLNFGCPVKKVVKRGAGAALMKDVSTLKKIAQEVARVSPVPVSAKIRKGWNEQNVNAVEVAKILEQCGIKAITIHPRTQAQQFRGQADWQVIREVKQAVSIPIIGSGDIRGAEDAKKMVTETGCDLVMIGRACLGNPWIFRQINHYLKTGEKIPAPSLTERLQMMLDHFQDMINLKGYPLAVYEMRKHFSWYLKGLPNSSKMRAELFRLKDIEDIKNLLIGYFRNLIENEKE